MALRFCKRMGNIFTRITKGYRAVLLTMLFTFFLIHTWHPAITSNSSTEYSLSWLRWPMRSFLALASILGKRPALEDQSDNAQRHYQKNSLPFEDENLTQESEMPPEFELSDNTLDSSVPLKKILLWNEVYRSPTFGVGFGREPFIRAGCDINMCMTTHNRSFVPLHHFDAVVWHFRSHDKSLPEKRSNHTRWVFFMVESPVHLFADLKPYNNLFNWTMTYRLDSDVPLPYGRVNHLRVPLPKSRRNYASTKTKLAAWFVSNCKTDGFREMYDVVPVVYGFGNYIKQAPHHSYIDVLDFADVEDLAQYLKYLNSNDTAYNEYFEWKSYYKVHTGWSNSMRSWCELCRRLHEDKALATYHDLEDWFVAKSHCASGHKKPLAPFIHGLHNTGPINLIK
ncbi:alpha-(1,3)-fucosyltransferase C-like isoform X3 [Oratosquilla oratoria]|uniref:alpha-(1,3)-fucosyltransferase C-like isoform X3 n=1 Tax=Oratosquilla oratoria TaxID=337810 RepID=UPI003F75D4C2